MNATSRFPFANDAVAGFHSRIVFRIVGCLLGICLAWMGTVFLGESVRLLSSEAIRGEAVDNDGWHDIGVHVDLSAGNGTFTHAGKHFNYKPAPWGFLLWIAIAGLQLLAAAVCLRGRCSIRMVSVGTSAIFVLGTSATFIAAARPCGAILDFQYAEPLTHREFTALESAMTPAAAGRDLPEALVSALNLDRERCIRSIRIRRKTRESGESIQCAVELAPWLNQTQRATLIEYVDWRFQAWLMQAAGLRGMAPVIDSIFEMGGRWREWAPKTVWRNRNVAEKRRVAGRSASRAAHA